MISMLFGIVKILGNRVIKWNEHIKGSNDKVMLGFIAENYFDLGSCLQQRLQTYSCTFYLSVWAWAGVLR